ncbi:unnamed protein product [Notodromas monacha]|uniref:Peptidase S1 domain-containing protein n=1 Tax=Notodromas monacha TaxID=399045 RepID=A0A7R9BCT7_9CRUS|nr:unnamed protein product [Notodromas monacha]CAG0912932.1 unnamed protein product [Notodromas monacha]
MHRALAYSLWIFGLLMHPVIIRGTLDARQDDIPVIIGGTILPDRRQSPWMVYLASDYGFIDMPCGGSLVSKSVILTAAQCVTFSFSDPGVFLKAQRVLYVLGGLTSKPDDETEEVYGWQDDPTNAIVVHPWYLGLKSLHDVALVKMSSAVTLTPYIGLVQLTSPGCNPEGLDVGVIGWGKTETDDTAVPEFFSIGKFYW